MDVDRLSMMTKRNRSDDESLETWASSREITLKSDSVGRGICNVCNITRAVSFVPWPFVRTSCGQKRTLASNAARAIKRARTTSSASALITARRRSYFTPRSSIIHAVNNAPLFRVTLYRGERVSFLPSFAHFLHSAGEGGGLRVWPGGKAPPRGTRSEVHIRSRHSYLQVYPPKRRHASV